MFCYRLGIEAKEEMQKIIRKAARAIILKGEDILVLMSDNIEVKIPGGGVEKNETFIDALHREVKEETGLKILKNWYFGSIITNKIDKEDKKNVFSMKSRYYIVETNSLPEQLDLQGYEVELNFRPVFLNIHEAIKKNEDAVKNNSENDIAYRELIAFREILKYISK